jgi:hypothetical protein
VRRYERNREFLQTKQQRTEAKRAAIEARATQSPVRKY